MAQAQAISGSPGLSHTGWSSSWRWPPSPEDSAHPSAAAPAGPSHVRPEQPACPIAFCSSVRCGSTAFADWRPSSPPNHGAARCLSSRGWGLQPPFPLMGQLVAQSARRRLPMSRCPWWERRSCLWYWEGISLKLGHANTEHTDCLRSTTNTIHVGRVHDLVLQFGSCGSVAPPIRPVRVELSLCWRFGVSFGSFLI